MTLRPTSSTNLESSSHGGDDNQDGQEVPECQGGNDHNGNEDKKPLIRANEEKEEVKVATVVLGH